MLPGDAVELLSALTKMFTAAAAAGVGGALYVKFRRNGGSHRQATEGNATANQAVLLGQMKAFEERMDRSDAELARRMDRWDSELARLAAFVRELPGELREDVARALAESGVRTAQLAARVEHINEYVNRRIDEQVKRQR